MAIKTKEKKVQTRKKPLALGRGLDNLLSTDLNVVKEITSNIKITSKKAKEIDIIKLSSIKSGVYQPRKIIDKEGIEELALSIKEEGVLQPILVRVIDKNKYEIIAGERRYLASKKAGLKEIPAIITHLDDKHAAAVALIENMQRQDLKPLEEASGIKRLIEEFELTHEQAAKSLGKSRSSLTNLLRLLNLTPEVQLLLNQEKIEQGHAKLLISLDPASQILVANQIVDKNWSVRETENYLKREPIKKKIVKKDQNIVRVEEKLSDGLGTLVSIRKTGNKKGHLQISFEDWDHLNDLLKRLKLLNLLED